MPASFRTKTSNASAKLWAHSLAMALLCGGCYQGAEATSQGGGGSADDGVNEGAEGSDGDTAEPLSCADGPVASPRPMRRLSPLQYQNTIRDLVGDPGFEAQYDDASDIATELAVRQLRNDAEAIVARSDAWTLPVFPCDLDAGDDDTCASDFIANFGTRVFRRPPTDEERTWLMNVYHDALSTTDFRGAMEIVFQTLLQAPPLLYLAEVGTPVEGAPASIRRLTDYELASRLSYFLWDSMPDDALLDAAARSELRDENELRAQVDRMLDDPRARAKVQHFASQWFQLDGGQSHFALEEVSKDPELFPEFDGALQEAMRVEFEATVQRVMFESDGNFERFFTDTSAYVNGPLAALYGVEGKSADDPEWEWVQLDPSQRAGLLTRAAFLTVFSNPNVHSPIRRGVFVLEQMLCTDLGDPPPNASDVPVEGGETVDENGEPVVRSVRDDVDARTSGPECSGCHVSINSAGFAFEHYDAVGRWQDEDPAAGTPIDSSGELFGGDLAGPVGDALELGQRLASSTRVKECFAQRWLEDSLGGALGELDTCSKDQITAQFEADSNVRNLLTQIVLSDAFGYINVGEGN